MTACIFFVFVAIDFDNMVVRHTVFAECNPSVKETLHEIGGMHIITQAVFLIDNCCLSRRDFAKHEPIFYNRCLIIVQRGDRMIRASYIGNWYDSFRRLSLLTNCVPALLISM